MGFFDFLKNIDIKAPEPQAQRGTLIQTDSGGGIATVPTDRGSRILSRDEFQKMEQDKRYLYDVSNEPEMRAMRANQGVGREQSLAREAMANRNQGITNVSPMDRFETFLSQDLRNPIEKLDQLALGRGSRDDFVFGKNLNHFTRANYPTNRINQLQNIAQRPASAYNPNIPAEVKVEQLDDKPVIEIDERPSLGDVPPSKEVQKIAMELINDAQRDFNAFMPMEQAIRIAKETINERNVGTLGGNMVGISDKVPSFTTQAYSGSQPNQGVTSFADAKNEISESKEGGIKDLNFLQKAMAVARNPIGRMMGYETDDQGRLTMKGSAAMEADKQVAEQNYQIGQFEKDRDRTRAMRNLQQTPFDPCPEGYTFDQSTQSCVADTPVADGAKTSIYGERNPMSLQEFMNQFRGEGETGNVPLTQYGRRGGEYQWWGAADGGLPRGQTGVVTGAGGPKDDLVGPIMLSNTEYVLPNEQVKLYGGGNYETGLKRLENDRMKALNNFA